MKTVLITLSVLNTITGGVLIALWALWAGNPRVMLALAAILLTQAGYTTWYLLSRGNEGTARNVLLAGQSLALLLGCGGLLSVAIENIGATDPEFGPLAVAGLIAAHAAASLLTFAHRPELTAD